MLAMGLDIGFSATGGLADVDAFAVTVFGPAFVDFARVVLFFVLSDISTSTGSEITFLGLPLFFATSEDILAIELGCGELWLREDSQKGNCKDRCGVILENLLPRRQFGRVVAELTCSFPFPRLHCNKIRCESWYSLKKCKLLRKEVFFVY